MRWSMGMDCVLLATCVSALEERKDLLKVASAFMAENALPLVSHHVKNFTTALKRMHPAVGKAVCVMCQCLNQLELGPFAESGGMPVLDIVKHVGAGIASVLPLGVVETRRAHLQPENDRTKGIDWMAHMPPSTSFKRSGHTGPRSRGSSASVPNTSWYCWARRNKSCPSAT